MAVSRPDSPKPPDLTKKNSQRVYISNFVFEKLYACRILQRFALLKLYDGSISLVALLGGDLRSVRARVRGGHQPGVHRDNVRSLRDLYNICVGIYLQVIPRTLNHCFCYNVARFCGGYCYLLHGIVLTAHAVRKPFGRTAEDPFNTSSMRIRI